MFVVGWMLDSTSVLQFDRQRNNIVDLLNYAQRQGNLLFFDCAIEGFLDSPTISFYVCFMSERESLFPHESPEGYQDAVDLP